MNGRSDHKEASPFDAISSSSLFAGVLRLAAVKAPNYVTSTTKQCCNRASTFVQNVKLAEQLRVHKSLPGKWIRGDRKIQPMHLQLIWQWLDPELHQVLGSQSI